MSYCTPAALKACSRKGRSAVSQRTDDLLSGRITPIFGVFAELVPPLFPELHAVKPPRTRRLAAAKVQMPLRIADPFWGVPPGRRQGLAGSVFGRTTLALTGPVRYWCDSRES